MLAKTHLAFGFLVGLVAMQFISTGNIFIFFGLVLIGSLLPDIDSPNSTMSSRIPVIPRIVQLFARHRGIFHSIFFAVIISGLFLYLTNKPYALALFIGYASHLVADGFTESGINFLHPVAKLHLSGFIKTGTYAEVVVLLIIIGLIFAQLL